MSDKQSASIIITLEIFPPDGKNNRKLVLAGAPHDEMPALKVGTFAERHQLLDSLWVELQKRKPQTIKHAATKDKQRAQDNAADEATTSSPDENASAETEQSNSADEEQFAQAVSAAKDEIENAPSASTEGDQLVVRPHEVASETPAQWQQDALPLIANDPTQEVTHG